MNIDINEFKLTLSSRQLEILKLRANGYLNKQIAYQLGICEDTVKEHVSRALNKMEFKSVTQAIVKLVRENII